ncbi:MAG: hypothetical protein HC831_00990 [Chloroflexia bacterium]|nr:hypothetical protein [Chloroflexia bacterium]
MYETNKAKNIIYLILLFSFAVPSHIYSQNNYKRKISISEWVEEMENFKGEQYIIAETEIYYDEVKDTLYAFWQPRAIKPTELDKKREKHILPRTIVYKCKLPVNKTCQLRNLIFDNHLSFYYCEGAPQFIFYNCTFRQGLDLQHSDLGNLEFWHSSILQRTVVNGLEISLLLFKNCLFSTDQKIVNSPHLFGDEIKDQPYQYLFRINHNQKNINTFYLSDCKILPTEVMPILYFDGGKYDNIQFERIDFSNSIVNFDNCSVKESFTVSECTFKQPLGMNRFNFPKDNTSFNWSQLDSVGLGFYPNYDQTPYTNKTDTLISDVGNYNELNSSYQKFHSMYRTQGDNESANACLIQMKDMETRKYRHLYQQNPDIRSWFNWRFNQFLKYFSEYGTNPVQSLIISMWAILIFAAVYFFFYSDWDGINRTFLIKQHRKIMLYFRSEQKLEDFYTENHMEDLKTFADYKKEMAENKVAVPAFIMLLGRPLYLLSMIKHKTVAFIYRRTEVLHGRWTDLEPVRKVFISITVVFSILIYLIYLGLVRALNSTTLSVNAFSTLGFGAIPVKGVSRYITILEGFLGWFLLSIFSVSLISQMLQN